MHLKYLPFFLFFFITTSSLFSQSKSVFTGTVTNKETDEVLSFASISLKNHPIGVISNEDGEFDFYIPESKRNDTLLVSFIGFNSYEIPLQIIKNPIKIELQPADNVLDEVVLSQLTPLDYIKRALDNLSENYPQDPYQTIAYYREKFIENNQIIKQEEAVFKTYYPTPKDTAKNQHQVLLYKPAENPQQFQFMREWIEKKAAKKKKKADKKGEEYDEGDYDGDIKMDFGGPQSVIHLDINHDKGNYLNEKDFKKYDYTFGDETSLNGEPLVTILFQAKRSIDHIKDSGKILISRESYAIVSIESTGKFSIPFLVKPILFTLGLRIASPQFSTTINYQKYQDTWYPNLFRWDAKVNLTKKYMFDENENAAINVGQIFVINKIDAVGIPIAKEKRFDDNEDLENQIYNDINIQWNELNSIKIK